MKIYTTAVVWLWVLGSCAVADETISATGNSRPELAAFDAWMTSFMTEHGIPGGALTIVREGKVAYSRGFGWADREAKEAVQPESLFRIASVSKPITAVAILQLAEQGKLKLDDKILAHLKYEPHFEPGGAFDRNYILAKPRLPG